MKSPGLSILFISLVACLLVVQARNECSCGGLGQGTNPCSCSKVVVKASKLPRPTHYVSPEEIIGATASKSNIVTSGGTSPCGCSNSHSSLQNSPVSYSHSTSDNLSNTSPFSEDHSKVDRDTTTYNSNSNKQGNKKNNQTPYSNREPNARSGTSNKHIDKNSSGAPERVIIQGSEVPYSDNYNEHNSQQNVESINIDDSTHTDGNVVPRFLPVGDLCYPLPRGENIVERTAKVTPAHPGKIVCCSPSIPYESCINTRMGEIKGRTIVSNFDGISRSNSKVYDAVNSGPFSKLPSAYSDSAPAAYMTPKVGSSSTGGSGSGLFNLSPFAYNNLNEKNERRQHSKITVGSDSVDYFDDAIGEIQDQYLPTAPADAVSLTLAYRNLHAPNIIYRKGKMFVPEDKLSFGHRTVPVDVKREDKNINIPEEKLVTVNKPVVELKIAPRKTVVVGSYNENEEDQLAELEAIENESMTHDESAEQITDGLITYKDLGYAPVRSTYKNRRMYQGIVKGDIIESSGEEPCGPLGLPKPDYVPGKVILEHEISEDNSGEVHKNMGFRTFGSKLY